jgi:hypothetical protein
MYTLSLSVHKRPLTVTHSIGYLLHTQLQHQASHSKFQNSRTQKIQNSRTFPGRFERKFSRKNALMKSKFVVSVLYAASSSPHSCTYSTIGLKICMNVTVLNVCIHTYYFTYLTNSARHLCSQGLFLESLLGTHLHKSPLPSPLPPFPSLPFSSLSSFLWRALASLKKFFTSQMLVGGFQRILDTKLAVV